MNTLSVAGYKRTRGVTPCMDDGYDTGSHGSTENPDAGFREVTAV